jgi:hypothetical protein
MAKTRVANSARLTLAPDVCVAYSYYRIDNSAHVFLSSALGPIYSRCSMVKTRIYNSAHVCLVVGVGPQMYAWLVITALAVLLLVLASVCYGVGLCKSHKICPGVCTAVLLLLACEYRIYVFMTALIILLLLSYIYF